MEELRASSPPEDGQFHDQLPEPFSYEAQYEAMIPEEVIAQTPEIEFDKRNERLRQQPKPQDELAAAGMIALGDVLKQRPVPQIPQVTTLPTRSQHNPMPSATGVSPDDHIHMSGGWSLYKQAVAVGVTAGLIMAPIIVLVLSRG